MQPEIWNYYYYYYRNQELSKELKIDIRAIPETKRKKEAAKNTTVSEGVAMMIHVRNNISCLNQIRYEENKCMAQVTVRQNTRN